jgi:hypothetical protein
MPITVTCTACGHQGRVGDEWAGRLLKCPKCGERFHVGSTKEAFEERPAYRPREEDIPTVEPVAREPDRGAYGLAESEPGSRGTCPECGTRMPPQAVICTGCGLDIRTGRKHQRQPARLPAYPAEDEIPRPSRSSGGNGEGGFGGILMFILIFGVGNAILYYFTGILIIPIRR